MRSIHQRTQSVALVLSVALMTDRASAAEYLCNFEEACLTAQSDQCNDVQEWLLVRTSPDSWVSQTNLGLQSESLFGDSDLFGTPGILSGNIVPAAFRTDFPGRLLAASPRLNMAERVKDITDQTGLRLSVIAPNLFTSPTEMMTMPKVRLDISDGLKSSFSVAGPLRANLTYTGNCEELN